MSGALEIVVARSFSDYVDRSGGPDACWPWTGSLTTNGYGQTRVKEGGVWRSAGAHQVAHFLTTGRWERKSAGRLVRHLCHYRPCCNGRHLRGGTPLDNANDRAARLARTPLVRPSYLCLPVIGIANRVFDGGRA